MRANVQSKAETREKARVRQEAHRAEERLGKRKTYPPSALFKQIQAVKRRQGR